MSSTYAILFIKTLYANSSVDIKLFAFSSHNTSSFGLKIHACGFHTTYTEFAGVCVGNIIGNYN